MTEEPDDRRAENPYAPPAPATQPAYRESVNARGVASCRAVLRRLGLPEHGPRWQPPEEER